MTPGHALLAAYWPPITNRVLLPALYWPPTSGPRRHRTMPFPKRRRNVRGMTKRCIQKGRCATGLPQSGLHIIIITIINVARRSCWYCRKWQSSKIKRDVRGTDGGQGDKGLTMFGTCCQTYGRRTVCKARKCVAIRRHAIIQRARLTTDMDSKNQVNGRTESLVHTYGTLCWSLRMSNVVELLSIYCRISVELVPNSCRINDEKVSSQVELVSN